MNKSLFYVIFILAVGGAIAVGVGTSAVLEHPIWTYLGLNIVWGYAGLVVALAITFPILRRLDIVGIALGAGWLIIGVCGVVPAVTYRSLQLWRDGVRDVNASELATLPHDHAQLVRLTGVWRYDVALKGTYKRSEPTARTGTCNLYTVHFCRVPIVAETWKPGEPVLAVRSCGGYDRATPDTVVVTLSPASETGLAAITLELDDSKGTHEHGRCVDLPDSTHPDLAKLAFDPDHGFFVTSGREGMNPIGMFVLLGLCFAIAMYSVMRGGMLRERVLTRGELDQSART